MRKATLTRIHFKLRRRPRNKLESRIKREIRHKRMIPRKWPHYYPQKPNRNNYDQVSITGEVRTRSTNTMEMICIKEKGLIINMTAMESTKCKWQNTINNIITNYTAPKVRDIQWINTEVKRWLEVK